MFNIEVKLKVNDREVPLEKFTTLFLGQAIHDALKEVVPKILPAAVQNTSSSPASHKAEVKPCVISIFEAARLLGLKPSTIRAWVLARKIAVIHLGRRVMIPTEAIDDLLSRGLIPARKER